MKPKPQKKGRRAVGTADGGEALNRFHSTTPHRQKQGHFVPLRMRRRQRPMLTPGERRLFRHLLEMEKIAIEKCATFHASLYVHLRALLWTRAVERLRARP